MVTPAQFPRCTVNLELHTVHRNRHGQVEEQKTHSMQGPCEDVFKSIQNYFPPKIELLKGRVSIEFVPDKKEI